MLAIALLVIIGCTPTGEVVNEQVKQPVKIGFIGPLTGDASAYGIPSKEGVELAVEEINNEGGINGRLLEVIYEDGLCNGKDASNAANKLINMDKVSVIIGGLCSAETLAAAPIAENAKVILLSTASSSPDITNAGDYIFRVWPSDAFQGVKMADHIYNTEGLKTTGVLYTNSDYNIGLKNVFAESFKSLGGQVIVDQTYEQDAKDFRTQLLKIKNANPEAIFMVPYAEGGIILKQIKELGLSSRLFGAEALGSQHIIDEAGNAAEGVIYTTPKFDEEDPNSKVFLERFRTKFGREPNLPVFVACGYDAMKIIFEAMKDKGLTSNEIKEYLYGVEDYPGACGTLSIDENGDAIKDFQLMIIKDRKQQEYQR